MKSPRSFWLSAAPAVALVLVAALGTGCGFLKKKNADEADAGTAPSASVTAAAETPDAAPPEETKPVDVDRIPWQGDEQNKAVKEINDTNYKSELDKMEQEINSAK